MPNKNIRYPRKCKSCQTTLHATAGEMVAHGKGHKVAVESLHDFFDLGIGDFVEDPKGTMKFPGGDKRVLKIQRLSEEQFMLFTEDDAFVFVVKPEEQANEEAE